MLKAKRVAALTGAGISAESGIPTFRGAGGLWEGYPVEKVATVEGFAEDPALVWRFYDERRVNMRNARPNLAHKILAELEKHYDMWVITQNIDGLHREAGSKNVIELHGNIWRVKCTLCDYHGENRETPLSEIPPKCPKCGALLRPDVVWFGEPVNGVEKAFRIAKESDVFFSIGTSALVHPAASLPFIAKDYGATVVEINPQRTPVSVIADFIIREKATVALDALFRELYKHKK
ncbi:MAG: NAD-dependent deacylase [Euryarchaeota archaeon]|nr:NAD-dependent deacylase [Euryarchaeota archaeon]